MPKYLVCSNPLYNVKYYGNGQIIEIDKGYMWFVHHIADIFALYLPKVASENISEKDFREIVSVICDVVIQVRKMKIHELLQTPVTNTEYKLASFFEYVL